VNGKWRATVVEIARMHKTGRPVLVGTTSVEQSEALSKQLLEASIPHQVEFVVYFHHFFCPHKPWQLSIILIFGELLNSSAGIVHLVGLNVSDLHSLTL
jgi:hypothetical protein